MYMSVCLREREGKDQVVDVVLSNRQVICKPDYPLFIVHTGSVQKPRRKR